MDLANQSQAMLDRKIRNVVHQVGADEQFVGRLANAGPSKHGDVGDDRGIAVVVAEPHRDTLAAAGAVDGHLLQRAAQRGLRDHPARRNVEVTHAPLRP